MRIRRNRQSLSIQQAPSIVSLTSSMAEGRPLTASSCVGEAHDRAALQCQVEDEWGSDHRDKGVAFSIVHLSPVIGLDIQEENGGGSPTLTMPREKPQRIQRSPFEGVDSPGKEESTLSRNCNEGIAAEGEQIVAYSVPAGCAAKAARTSRHRTLPEPGRQTSIKQKPALFPENDDEDDVDCSNELSYIENRCRRRNGRGWRCHQRTLVGYSLCEYHLGKSRLRNINKSFGRLSRTSADPEDLPGLAGPSADPEDLLGFTRMRSRSRKQVKARSMKSMPCI